MTAPNLGPGALIAGKYAVTRRLGFGGSSSTYLTTAPDRRELVVRVYDPAIRNRPDAMAAMQQTNTSVNSVGVDVVAPILDAGFDQATGAPFSATEWVAFPSLAELAATRPLSPQEVAAVLSSLGRALDAAHQRQLAHHALKPANVFVGFARGYGVRLTDFGASIGRNAVPTPEGYALAAPWLAPEQAQPGVPPGPPADVFAAALVAFFALTGRPYWLSCVGTVDFAAWRREVMSPRVPPSMRAQQLGSSLNPAFDAVIGRGLAPNPAERWPSVGELARAFEAVAASAAQAAPAQGAPQGNVAPMAEPAAAPAFAPVADYPAAGPPPAQGAPQPAYQGAAYSANAAPPPNQPAPYMAPMAQPPQAPAPYAPPPPAPMPPQAAPAAVQAFDPGPQSAVSSVAGVPKKKSGLVLGLVVAVVLVPAACAIAWFALLRPSPPVGPIAVAPPPSAAVAPPPSAAATTPAPAPSASDTGSAAAAPTPEPSASAAPEAPIDAGSVETTASVRVHCEPSCEELKIDDKPVDVSGGAPVVLSPGKHVFTVVKAGFVPVRETVVVTPGPPIEKVLTLVPARGVAQPPRPKPCHFLHNCK